MKTGLVLAQTDSLWHQGASQGEMTVLWISLGVVAALIVIVLIYRGLKGEPVGPAPKRSAASFRRSSFRRAAREAGLSEDDVRFLEDYGRLLSVANPEFVFRNEAKLDAFFKDAFRLIEKNSESEAHADERKAKLFAAREHLTRQAALGTPIRSSRQLGRNLPLTFIAPGEESYPSVVVASEPGGLAIEPARDPYGEPIRVKKGAKITCFFYSAAHQGFQFTTRVAGWSRIGTKEVMLISHSDAVAALPARRHARREMRAPCTYYRMAVAVSKVRGKEQSTARVENLPFPGTIVDISAGGIGIQSANVLQAGEYMKIEFSPNGGTLAAFCKVIRTNAARNLGGVMHAQFVKISRRTLNAILSFVYGYAE